MKTKLIDFLGKIKKAGNLDGFSINPGGVGIVEKGWWRPKWTITKYDNDEAFRTEIPSAVEVYDGNLLLNEGITELLTLLIGGTATPFSNTNARIGVGDSNTAAVAAQTDLQASTNKLYKVMDASYPQVSNQIVKFRSTFGATEANWAWNEITVANGADGTAKNLNRKVQGMGTKANPAIWVVELNITIS